MSGRLRKKIRVSTPNCEVNDTSIIARTLSEQLALDATHRAPEALDAILDLLREPLTAIFTHSVRFLAPMRVSTLLIPDMRS